MATDRNIAQFGDTNLASMSTNRSFAQFQNTDGDSPVYCTHIKLAIIASVTLVSVIFCNIGNQIARNAPKRCQHCNRNRAALRPTAILAVSQTSLETPFKRSRIAGNTLNRSSDTVQHSVHGASAGIGRVRAYERRAGKRAGPQTVKCYECLSEASSHSIGLQAVRAGAERA